MLLTHLLSLQNLKCFFFSSRYVSIGDIAHIGSHPPNVAAVYRKVDRLFAPPVGYDLVRNLQLNHECKTWLGMFFIRV